MSLRCHIKHEGEQGICFFLFEPLGKKPTKNTMILTLKPFLSQKYKNILF